MGDAPPVYYVSRPSGDGESWVERVWFDKQPCEPIPLDGLILWQPDWHGIARFG